MSCLESQVLECLPKSWVDSLSSSSSPLSNLAALFEAEYDTNNWPESLKEYLEACKSLAMPREAEKVPDDLATPNTRSSASEIERLDPVLCIGMKQKKIHEVRHLSNVIHKVCGGETKTVIDIGSGKGYIAQALAHHFGYNVIGLEGNEGQHEKAVTRFAESEKRRQKRQKKKTQRSPHPLLPLPSIGCHSLPMIDGEEEQSEIQTTKAKGEDEERNLSFLPFSSSSPSSSHLPSMEKELNHNGKTSEHSPERLKFDLGDGQDDEAETISQSHYHPAKMHSTVNYRLTYSSEAGELDLLVKKEMREEDEEDEEEEDEEDEEEKEKGDSGQICIMSLHACGDLSPIILELFASWPRAVQLVNVGCCYHKMESDELRKEKEKEEEASSSAHHSSSDSVSASVSPFSSQNSSSKNQFKPYPSGFCMERGEGEAKDEGEDRVMRGFPLSRSVRNLIKSNRFNLSPFIRFLELGTGSPRIFERMDEKEMERRINKVEFRSILQLIFREIIASFPDISKEYEHCVLHVQKMKSDAAFESFAEYLKRALPRAHLKRFPRDSSSILASLLIPNWDSSVFQSLLANASSYYERLKTDRSVLRVWLSIESSATSIAESLIILDRWLFLEEKNEDFGNLTTSEMDVENAISEQQVDSSSSFVEVRDIIVPWILPVFDQEESPRNLALIARKERTTKRKEDKQKNREGGQTTFED